MTRFISIQDIAVNDTIEKQLAMRVNSIYKLELIFQYNWITKTENWIVKYKSNGDVSHNEFNSLEKALPFYNSYF